MRVERILSESDLLPQRIHAGTRRAREGVLSEDAIEFEGKEQRKENSEQQYSAYNKKNKALIVPAEENQSKEEIDIIA